jgi:hypothetical protein
MYFVIAVKAEEVTLFRELDHFVYGLKRAYFDLVGCPILYWSVFYINWLMLTGLAVVLSHFRLIQVCSSFITRLLRYLPRRLHSR